MRKLLCLALLGAACAASGEAPTSTQQAGGRGGIGGTGGHAGVGGTGGTGYGAGHYGPNCDIPETCRFAAPPAVLGEPCEEGDACQGPVWLASHCGMATTAVCCNGVWQSAFCPSSGGAGEGGQGQSGAGASGDAGH